MSWLVSGGLSDGLVVGLGGGSCFLAWSDLGFLCRCGSSSMVSIAACVVSVGFAGTEARSGGVLGWGLLGGGGGLPRVVVGRR